MAALPKGWCVAPSSHAGLVLMCLSALPLSSSRPLALE